MEALSETLWACVCVCVCVERHPSFVGKGQPKEIPPSLWPPQTKYQPKGCPEWWDLKPRNALCSFSGMDLNR